MPGFDLAPTLQIWCDLTAALSGRDSKRWFLSFAAAFTPACSQHESMHAPNKSATGRRKPA